MTRFAFIDREKAFYDVAVLCRLLKVSRSGFYAWRSRPRSARALADEVLTEQIRTAYDDNRQVYGAPRIHAELADAGVQVGRKRVARLMRAAEIVGCHRRTRPFGITRQDPRAEAAPDRVDRKFVASAPNQLWVADVTYVPTLQGWLYLACVTDVFSRMVIGWSMASHRKTDLVVDAVNMAVHRRGGRVPGVIHHSDRGGEGGFNRSSQHLVILEVSDGSSAASSRPSGAPQAEVARASEVPARGGDSVLGRDRQGAAA